MTSTTCCGGPRAPRPWPRSTTRPTATPSCATAPASTATTWPARPAGATSATSTWCASLTTPSPAVDGSGFRTTPIVRSTASTTSSASSRGAGVWVKDETGNVSGSHKARHLMGVMLALRVAEALGLADPDAPLAIASCGNAALAAAVVARAAAPPPAGVRAAERRAGGRSSGCASLQARARGLRARAGPGRRPQRASADGRPSLRAPCRSPCRATSTASPSRAAQTLAWELIDQLPDDASALDRLVVHVGGGAFASAAARAFEEAVAARSDRAHPHHRHGPDAGWLPARARP